MLENLTRISLPYCFYTTIFSDFYHFIVENLQFKTQIELVVIQILLETINLLQIYVEV